jgi:hypothetical protein
MAYLIIAGDNLIANLQLPVFHRTSMEDVSVENLNVLDRKLGHTVDNDTSGIVLLTSRLRIHAGLVEQNTK